MLGDFTLFDLFSERCTVASTVATSTPDLLCSLRHDGELMNMLKLKTVDEP